MDSLVLPFAVICSLALAGVALSFVSLFHATASLRVLERRTHSRQTRLEDALAAADTAIQGLAAQVRQIHEQSPGIPSSAPRPGLNLSTRSQALRMHRRGETPGQIAAVLQVPVQEVELLLKVHRIVLQNLAAAPQAQAAPAEVRSA